MKKYNIRDFLFLAAIFIGIASFQDKENTPQADWTNDVAVADVLFDMGNPRQKHYINPTAEQIKKGEEIVKVGCTTDANGKKKQKPVSKYYFCTSCHNLQREDPILSESNAETRFALCQGTQNSIPPKAQHFGELRIENLGIMMIM